MQTTTQLQKAFKGFHKDNPEVYQYFMNFTLEVITKGFKQYSADAIMHRVRWETNVVTNDTKYKINNNHISYYARKFVEDFPEHKGFFNFRVLRGA